MAYALSTDQVEALRAIGRWWRSKSSPYITLGGYAGTGKTTIVALVRQALRENDPEVRVAFCAFTGKAVRVLEQTLKKHKITKRKDSISTIHGLIYRTELDKDGHIVGWRRKSELDVDLIIVDEASMVTKDLWDDLLFYGIPILAVGDHGQLPPVGSNFNLMAEPQLKLERVYRQAEGSGIVEVATMARTSGIIPAGKYGSEVVKHDRRGDEIGVAMEEILEQWKPDWLVLCGYNHTRVRLNQSLRGRMGFELPTPVTGDHVVCLRNNVQSKLYNGTTGVISWIHPSDELPDVWWRAGVKIEDDEYDGLLLKEQFGARETIKNIPPSPDPKERGDLFDFGYALTVHKAQGSAADTVLLFEERNKHMTDDDWCRWLYTGVTRAAKRLIIIGD
jgi:exodeoxyribonuclease-5